MSGMTITPRASGFPGYSETMPRMPERASKARSLTRVALFAWHMNEAEDSAALLVSELFTNAVRHARGASVRVIVNRPAEDRVYLAVVDRAPHRLPELREAGPDDVGGRGLALVEDLAHRWGYDRLGGLCPWGKRVWVEMKVTR